MWVGKYPAFKRGVACSLKMSRGHGGQCLTMVFLKRFSVYHIMTDQDIKDILDIEVKGPPRTPQLSKEAIMGTLKVKLGSGAL